MDVGQAAGVFICTAETEKRVKMVKLWRGKYEEYGNFTCHYNMNQLLFNNVL